MKNYINDLFIIFIFQLFITVSFAYFQQIPIFNPLFIFTEVLLILLFIVIIARNLNKKIPSYEVVHVRKKWFLIFLLSSILPFITNTYLDQRVVKIDSINELMWIKWNPGGKYVLNTDLDFTDYKNKDKQFIIENFKGTFDGNNHTIHHLNTPLFQYNYGTIKQLNLDDVAIVILDSEQPIGALVNLNFGTISHVHVEGRIEANSTIGGIVGKHNFYRIEYSSFTGEIIGRHAIGGIAGVNNGVIKASFAQGNINGIRYLGGIAGISYSEHRIENCYSHVDIIGESFIGGIVGSTSYKNGVKASFVLGNLIGVERVGAIEYESDQTYKGLIVGNINSSSYQYEPNLFYNINSFVNIPNEQSFSSNMMTKEWFINELQLDESIWDFSPLVNNELPVIKGIPIQPHTKFE